jgi:predicted MPP superfamily phosphohydrolase
MIARIFIPIILAIVLPDLYIYVHYLSRRNRMRWWKRLLWWLPGLLMMAYTVGLTSIHNFAPDDMSWLNLYLILVGLFVMPKAIFVLCSALGLAWCRLRHSHHNWGNLVGLLLAVFAVYVLLYGSLLGYRKLEVKHVDVYFKDLPPAFDGYRIVHFSDLHLGTFQGGYEQLVERDIDSINAQHADLIAFTGDLQNLQPAELYPFQDMLGRLKAKDGVFSVLGNHDYSMYIDADPAVKVANERETVSRQRQFGWNVLLNEHRSIYRGQDSIVIAGEENDGKKPFPRKANLEQTLQGVGAGAFVLLLQHDPSAWRRTILSSSEAQLTLSGHTHGGQLSIFGFRPSHLVCREDCGLYMEADRAIYVSAGLGGLVRFRFGVPPEIAVITLHKLQ